MAKQYGATAIQPHYRLHPHRLATSERRRKMPYRMSWAEPIALPAVHAGYRDAARAAAGSEIRYNGWPAVAWCVGLAILGYFWSTVKVNSDPK